MGIGNFGNMMKVMNAWNTFKQNHPKFPAFCSAVSKRGIREGSILEVTYISPEGEKLTTNIKVQASDIELLRQISGGIRGELEGRRGGGVLFVGLECTSEEGDIGQDRIPDARGCGIDSGRAS